MALLAVSAVAVVDLVEVVDLLAVSAVVDLLAVSAGEGLLVVVDFVGVGVGARVGAGGGPASMAPIAGGVRVAAVGSAHTIDRPDRIDPTSSKTSSPSTPARLSQALVMRRLSRGPPSGPCALRLPQAGPFAGAASVGRSPQVSKHVLTPY